MWSKYISKIKWSLWTSNVSIKNYKIKYPTRLESQFLQLIFCESYYLLPLIMLTLERLQSLTPSILFFDKALTPFRKTFLQLNQLFVAKLLLFGLPLLVFTKLKYFAPDRQAYRLVRNMVALINDKRSLMLKMYNSRFIHIAN